MAIVINLPESKKSVTILNHNSLQDLLLTSNSESLEKLATSYLFFQRLIAYIDLLGKEEFSEEEINDHLAALTSMYTNYLEFETPTEDAVGDRVQEIIASDDFGKKYGRFLESMTGELFRLFACGALALSEGEAYIGGLNQSIERLTTVKA